MSDLQPTCSTCRRPITTRPENRYFPFCSDRCKMADLGRWLDGGYTIPVTEDATERALRPDAPAPAAAPGANEDEELP